MGVMEGSVDARDIFNNTRTGFIVNDSNLESYKERNQKNLPALEYSMPNPFDTLEAYLKNIKEFGIVSVIKSKNSDNEYFDVTALDKRINIVVYNWQYALLLRPILNGKNPILKKEESGREIYLFEVYSHYHIGFIEGLVKFKSQIRPPEVEMFGENRNAQIQLLKHLYFKKPIKPLGAGFKGVSYVKKRKFQVFPPIQMHMEGLNSGLTYAIEEFAKEYEFDLSIEPPVKPSVNIHPEHDPNLWNIECFELFKYLYDNYNKGKIRQLTNIWFFLKEDESSRYAFFATKEKYKIFIKESYQLEIKNFDKAQTKYIEKDLISMNEHRIAHEDSLK